MKTVEKKILPKYFQTVRNERKNFELRKDEDNIQPGDILILREWNDGQYTGRMEARKVMYVLRTGINAAVPSPRSRNIWERYRDRF